jgi:hypothetical protein
MMIKLSEYQAVVWRRERLDTMVHYANITPGAGRPVIPAMGLMKASEEGAPIFAWRQS